MAIRALFVTPSFYPDGTGYVLQAMTPKNIGARLAKLGVSARHMHWLYAPGTVYHNSSAGPTRINGTPWSTRYGNMTEGTVTRDAICERATELSKGLNDRDALMVFIGGHGVHVPPDESEIYLDFDANTSRTLRAQDIGQMLDALPGHQLLVTQACHDYGFGGAMSTRRVVFTQTSSLRMKAQTRENRAQLFLQHTLSGGSYQESYELANRVSPPRPRRVEDCLSPDDPLALQSDRDAANRILTQEACSSLHATQLNAGRSLRGHLGIRDHLRAAALHFISSPD